jgi:catechol 2,3-dioxygenase-like lactoylglutathione lyase family enzyme
MATITLYCATDEQAAAATALAGQARAEFVDVDGSIEIVRVADGGVGQALPLTVLQVMALKGADTFPLTLVGEHPGRSGDLPELGELYRWSVEGLDAPVALVTEAVSAVHFEGESRVHISLDVTDIERSLPFYMVLFNARPVKRRDDYVKFELDEPRLNITLNQHDDSHASSGHYGIQVKTSTAVRQATERLRAAGFAITEEEETACCYAVQSKIWVVDPDGNRWEVFLVTAAEADEGCGPDCVCYADLERSFVSAGAAAAAAATSGS